MKFKLPKKKSELVIVGAMTIAFMALAVLLFSLLVSVRGLNAETDGLRDLSHRMKIFSGRFNEVRSAINLIDAQDSSQALDGIIKTGNAHGINFQSIEAQRIKVDKKASYQSLPIDIKTRSGFQALGEFLTALNGLDAAVVSVRSFEITKSPIAPEVHAHINVEVLLNHE